MKPLTMSIENARILSILHEPAYTQNIIVWLIALALFPLNMVVEWLPLIFPLFGLAIASYELLTEHQLLCTFNKETGFITYRRGGVLGTKLGAQSTQAHISEVTGIELNPGGQRSKNLFQCRLVINESMILNLSMAKVKLEECQNLAETINKFLGLRIPVKVME